MSGSKGFTLIELLIAVVIIGILAAIAIPKFANTKEKAFKANMKSDLRNMASAQEVYLYDHATYYTGAVPDAQLAFAPSSGVTLTLSGVSSGGWAASAAHSPATPAPTTITSASVSDIVLNRPAYPTNKIRRGESPHPP